MALKMSGYILVELNPVPDGKGNVNTLTGLANNTIVKGNNLPRILGKMEKIARSKK